MAKENPCENCEYCNIIVDIGDGRSDGNFCPVDMGQKCPKLNVLHLTLKRKWFDRIATGEKVHEYREIKDYWRSRLLATGTDAALVFVPKVYDEVHFRNGYARDAPFIRVEWKNMTIMEYDGKPHFCIHLGKVLEVRNWKQEVEQCQ